MNYQKATSFKAPAEKIVDVIQKKIQQNKKVLWLVSGGSAIEVAVEASKKLENQPLLVVMQIDERFCPVGHNDSNWQQLINKGFKLNAFACHPVLTGKDIEQTTKDYSELLNDAVKAKDFVIGLFGIGVDGHTVGILPGSVAAAVRYELIVHYEAPDFNRITVTPPFFADIDMAVVFAMGEKKANALNQLQQDLAVSDQPAQALKLARELYVYTDYQGDTT